MRAIFRNKTVIVVSLFLTLFISSFTWVAVGQAKSICSGDANTCVMEAPSKGRMIWDDVARGLIRSLSI